jgi:hypothetical protein
MSMTHMPSAGLQTRPLGHVTPMHRSGPHTPAWQIWPAVQVTLAQVGSQWPARHASVAAQVTVAHGSLSHAPLVELQSCPSGQPRPRQLSSTHAPVRGLHTSAPEHVTPSHANVQELLRQTHAPVAFVGSVG